MAVVALFFKLGVPGNQGPRHHQLLENSLRAGAKARRHRKERSNDNGPCDEEIQNVPSSQ